MKRFILTAIAVLFLALLPANAYALDTAGELARVEAMLGFRLPDHRIEVRDLSMRGAWGLAFITRQSTPPRVLDAVIRLDEGMVASHPSTWRWVYRHELGHLLIAMLGLPRSEDWADRFAVCYYNSRVGNVGCHEMREQIEALSGKRGPVPGRLLLSPWAA